MSSTVTITVLFTDWVDSTAITSRLGPEVGEALRRTHYGLLRSAVAASDGSEVKSTGDGVMVTFRSVSAALECAVAIQQAIDRHNRTAREPLAVRIGVSHGEAEQDDDGDYYGTSVVEAARLCALAEGGQILSSELVRLLASGRSGNEFIDRGSFQLKGLPEPVVAHELRWEARATPSALTMPPRLARQATTARFGFHGRSLELTTLEGSQKRVLSDRCLHAVLVSGEAGIGKTTLIAHTARRAHDAGDVVLFGHCDEELGIAYQPWVEVLTPLVLEGDGAAVGEFAPAHRAALARLIPALSDAPVVATRDLDNERVVLFEAVRSLLTAVARQSAVVVVLDDLHWADSASLQVLRYLVTNPPGAPILVVGTYRDTDLSRDHPLAQLLADFRREAHTERITLSGLSDLDVAGLMADAAGHDLGADGVALAHALRRETDGNPFFTEELLRHLRETGTIAQGPDGRWSLRAQPEDVSLPSSVTEVVARRIGRLGAEVARTLSTAAVIGREFDLAVLSSVIDLSEDTLLDALERATDAGVVVERELVAGRYRFVHALFQHTLYRDVSATRRQRLHHQIAEQLEVVDAGRGRYVAELAHHWLAATQPTELDKAMDYVLRAADAARAALAPDDAIRWYQQARELLADASGDQRSLGRILVGLGEAQSQLGLPEARDTLLEAARIARELEDNDLLVAAALSFVRGSGQATIVDPARVEVTQAAIDAAGPNPSGARARLLVALAESLDARDWERRRDLGAEAVAVARLVGDEAVLLVALTGAYQTVSAPETLPTRLSTTLEAIALADRIGDAVRAFTARLARVDACMQAGDLIEVDRRLAEMREIADAVALPRMRWLLDVSSSWRLLLQGEIHHAEEANDRSFEVGTRIGQPEALMVYGAQLFQIRAQQGRLDEIVDVIAEATAANPQIPSSRAMLAFAYCELGRFDDARTLFVREATDAFREIPRTNAWLSGIALWGNTAAALGDREVGQDLYARLEAFADQVMMVYVVVIGSVAVTLGNLASLLGRFDDAERHLRQALAVHERFGAPYLVATTQLDLATALSHRQRTADSAEIASLVSSAQATAAAHGFTRLAARARGLA